jgi:D-alanine-D-alanine ligase
MATQPLHVGVLFSDPRHGGASEPATGALDRRSAVDLAQAIEALGHLSTLLPADDDLSLALSLRGAQIDACLIAAHGDLGGSGKLQEQLGRCAIPWVGAPAAAVALAYDKIRARERLARFNLPIPTGIACTRGAPPDRRGLHHLGWPCILKPRSGSLSSGLLRLHSSREVADIALDEHHHGREILIERECDGIEVQVVVLGGRILGAMQIERRPGALTGVTAMSCPPELSSSALDGLHHLARHAAEALGLADHLCRVDIMVSDRHNEQILEVEPLPPLNRDGVVARVARAAGLSYERLVATLLAGVARPLYAPTRVAVEARA